MSLEYNIEGLCKQKCVYWRPIGNDGFGRPLFATAVEIDCRWEEKAVLFSDEKGKEVLAKAVVHVLIDVKLEGYLYNGRLSEISTPYRTNPYDVNNAYPIKRFDKSPALSDPDVYVRKAYLTPYGGMN